MSDAEVIERAAASPEATPDRAKRRQILDGARRVFLAQGFDAASMGEIAKAAGVSKGTLYVYFDSKEALFEALTLSEKEGLAEALFRLDESDPDIRGVLSRLGRSFLQAMVTPAHIASVRMVIGAADRFPRFGQAYYEAGPRNGVGRLSRYLDSQVAAGRLACEDTQVAAEHFLGLCSSGLLRKLLFAAIDRVSDEEIVRAVEGAVRIFYAAYRPPTAES
ncbi:MAG: TetR/AcrR family transcriptional regulator [Methylobacteriaceae bacterium]|nr:TetR/AcrR family transcriptional regulator [Methylobacteriaceae bacterium]